MIRIVLNNNKGKLEGELVKLNKIRNELKVKHPNAFHIRSHMPKGWDGCVYYITEAAYFKTGLFPAVVAKIEELGYSWELRDLRVLPTYIGVPEEVSGTSLRGYQYEAVKALVENTVGEVEFPVGVINAATNAGKTYMLFGVHLSFRDNVSIILLNNTALYDQFIKDMPKVFADGEWGCMKGKDIRWGSKINVVMVQTLINNLQRYREELNDVSTVIIDECDLGTSKTYRKCIEALYNAPIRVGLSGTVFMSKLKKDELKHLELHSFMGYEVFIIKNHELIDMGISTKPIIKIIQAPNRPSYPDYPTEYRYNITLNEDRHQIVYERVIFNLKHGRKPMLVVAIFHEHVENLYKFMKDKLAENKISCKFIHHEVKDRAKIIEKFRKGKLDVLITSMIIKRGQNMPLIKYICNAGGGDSAANVLQVLGRGLRTSETKNRIYLDDIYDSGKYLQRHSKHRVNYYKNEQIKVIKKF